MTYVEDIGAHEQFLAKRKQWFSWYDADDDEPNAVLTQIHLMLLTEMSYRVLIKEYQHQSDNKLYTPLLEYLLNNGYSSSQLLAIRRLYDSTSDVISLRRVLSDLQKHKHLLTREIYVSWDGLPYEAEYPQFVMPGFQPEDSPFSSYTRSKRRHEQFDRLSRISVDERSRFDRIHPATYSRLEAWLDDNSAQRLIKTTNKYLAHAAAPQSRQNVQPTGLSFLEIEAIQKSIVRVSRAIFDIILDSSVYSEVVPHMQLGFFGKVWDGTSMIVSTSRMNTHWDELAEIRNRWQDNLESDLCA